VTTHTSEFGRAWRGIRAAAPLSDRAAATRVEPVLWIALRQQDARASLGRSEVGFLQQVRPHLRVTRSEGERASVKQGSLVVRQRFSW
jgi:hypothetical protein